MKKLLVFSMLLVSYVSYGQTTIGGVTSINFRGAFDANYGGWIDIKEWGFDYVAGATLSDETPDAYLIGKSTKYTAGSVYQNYGIHRNYKGLDGYYYSIGGGIQSITDITTSGNEISSLPYANFSMGQRFSNDTYFIKGMVNLGKITSFGIGFGLVIK